MKIKILKIEEDIREGEFPDYINKEGYKCIKLKISNYKQVKRILGCGFELGIGMPDFLIYNKKEKFLCEFKSKTDNLSLNQIDWAVRNSDIPLMWALVILEEKEKEPQEIEMDTEWEEQNRRSEIAWKIRNYYLEKYVEAHPEEIGVSLREHNGGYVGKIPTEVGLAWDKFDEIFFKDKSKQKEIIKIYEENNPNIKEVVSLLP